MAKAKAPEPKEEKKPAAPVLPLDKLEEKYGKRIIHLGLSLTEDLRLRSRIFSLDLRLSGGFPIGRVSSVYGADRAGKSTLALVLIRSFLECCMRCWEHAKKCVCKKGPLPGMACYVDTEHAFDMLWANQMGVDLSRIKHVEPDSAEQAFDIFLASIRDPRVGLSVFDTLGMSITEGEMDMDAGESLHASPVKTVTWMIKNMNQLLVIERGKGHLVLPLLLNQVRANMNRGMHGPALGQPSGWCAQHTPKVRIKMSPGADTYKKEKPDLTVDRPIGCTTYFSVEKNKSGVGIRDGQYSLMRRTVEGYPPIGYADEYKLVLKAGLYIKYIREEGLSQVCGDVKYSSLEAIVAKWKNDHALFLEDSETILTMILAQQRERDRRKVQGENGDGMQKVQARKR